MNSSGLGKNGECGGGGWTLIMKIDGSKVHVRSNDKNDIHRIDTFKCKANPIIFISNTREITVMLLLFGFKLFRSLDIGCDNVIYTRRIFTYLLGKMFRLLLIFELSSCGIARKGESILLFTYLMECTCIVF